jgi:hypothetical protein
MSALVLLPLAVNSKSERKFNSLPPLGFEPVIFGMLAHLSDHSAKSHPDAWNKRPSLFQTGKECTQKSKVSFSLIQSE